MFSKRMRIFERNSKMFFALLFRSLNTHLEPNDNLVPHPPPKKKKKKM